MSNSTERSGVAYGLGAYITWGLLTIYWKFLKQFNAVELIGWRIVTSSIILLCVIIYTKKLRNLLTALRDRKLRARVIFASIMLAINWTTYVWAVVHENVIETALGYFISPLFTMIIGFAVLRETMKAAHRAVIVFAVVAIVILTYSYGRPPYLALIIASSWSIYGYLKKQVPLSSLESLTAEVFALLIPAVAILFWCFNRADSVPNNATTIQWIFVLLTGLMTAIPLLLFGAASRRVRLSLLGPLQYFVPTFNFFLGWLAYNEKLDISRVIGFAFVWFGLVILITDSLRTSAKKIKNA
ncbi:MAG: EamA family transporter RarD [Actinobacteria bacterium]|nr:EamA family transporter RarD [Actinomycetota bacterium]